MKSLIKLIVPPLLFLAGFMDGIALAKWATVGTQIVSPIFLLPVWLYEAIAVALFLNGLFISLIGLHLDSSERILTFLKKMLLNAMLFGSSVLWGICLVRLKNMGISIQIFNSVFAHDYHTDILGGTVLSLVTLYVMTKESDS